MLAVVSRRKAPLRSAAWSGLSGGHSRVLERPLRGALAITPIAQVADDPDVGPGAISKIPP
jgi:hypothetical protein